MQKVALFASLPKKQTPQLYLEAAGFARLNLT